MIFNLSCPECLTINLISSEVEVVEWVCNNCNAEPTTSLGIDENGDFING